MAYTKGTELGVCCNSAELAFNLPSENQNEQIRRGGGHLYRQPNHRRNGENAHGELDDGFLPF